MQPSTAFIPVTTALVILTFLAIADLELLTPLPHAGRASAPVASVPFTLPSPPVDHALEDKRLREAADCIDHGTTIVVGEYEPCLQIYAADFPNGTGFTLLYRRRDSRITFIDQAAARAAHWRSLADVVAEDVRAASPRADKAVRDALSQVRPIVDSATDEQRRLFENAEPVARAVDESEARRAALRTAAQHWRTRSGIDFEDYSKARGAITAYDHNAFSGDDQSAWETLDAADALIAWSKREMTPAVRAHLPIAIVRRSVDELDYGLTRAIANDLASSGFRTIVQNVSDAAVMIELSDIRMRTDPTYNATRKHAAYDEAEYQAKFAFGLRLVWIGARESPPDKIADGETDSKAEAVRAAVEKTAATAVASFESFTSHSQP
jgi:hypothetical protein